MRLLAKMELTEVVKLATKLPRLRTLLCPLDGPLQRNREPTVCDMDDLSTAPRTKMVTFDCAPPAVATHHDAREAGTDSFDTLSDHAITQAKALLIEAALR